MKLLLGSYYDIVRKNIEDSVPKAIMHFLVNHTRRELHNVFIVKLYRENLLEEILQGPEVIAIKRKRTKETLRVLRQAMETLDSLPQEADAVEKGYCGAGVDTTGLPRIHGLPTSSMFSSSSSSGDFTLQGTRKIGGRLTLGSCRCLFVQSLTGHEPHMPAYLVLDD